MSLYERLRSARTVEDFERLKSRIEYRDDEEVFANITSPVVMRACIDYIRLSREELCRMSRVVTLSFRVDLLEVFFERIRWIDYAEDVAMMTQTLQKVVAEGATDVILYFFDIGMPADLMFHNMFMYFPILSWACSQGKVDVVDILLMRGANANLIDSRGETPAFYALRSGDVRILDRLIVYGADVYHRNRKGENLWSAIVAAGYNESMKENFQRIADMGVHLDLEVYLTNFKMMRMYGRNSAETLFVIMRGVLEKQGVQFDRWGMPL